MFMRPLLRTALAVVAATFAVGATVSLRLHLRLAEPIDWPSVLSQGLEITWFSVFAFPAACAAMVLARSWPAFNGQRLLVGVVAYALAFAWFVLVFVVEDPRVGADIMVNLYLAVGSFAGVLAMPRAKAPPPAVVPVAHAS